jgi:hypothetical protein
MNKTIMKIQAKREREKDKKKKKREKERKEELSSQSHNDPSIATCTTL